MIEKIKKALGVCVFFNIIIYIFQSSLGFFFPKKWKFFFPFLTSTVLRVRSSYLATRNYIQNWKKTRFSQVRWPGGAVFLSSCSRANVSADKRFMDQPKAVKRSGPSAGPWAFASLRLVHEAFPCGNICCDARNQKNGSARPSLAPAAGLLGRHIYNMMCLNMLLSIVMLIHVHLAKYIRTVWKKWKLTLPQKIKRKIFFDFTSETIKMRSNAVASIKIKNWGIQITI